MNHGETENKIRSIVGENGVKMVDLQIGASRYGTSLKIFADTDEGITIDQISKVHSAVHAALPELFDDADSVFIQVSSPGLDAPLRFPWQYIRHKGRTLNVSFRRDDAVTSVSGEIAGATENEVILITNGQNITIPFKLVERALIQIKI